MQDGGQFPGQIVRFGDAGIASQATAGWLGARGITHQEDPADLEAISRVRARCVGQHGFELHRQIRDSHGCWDKLEAACLRIVSERLFLRVIAKVQPIEIWSRSRAWVRDKRSTRDGVVAEETHDGMLLAEQLHQVGLEDHTDAMKQARCSMLADAELLTNPTVAAVSRHQKLGANRAPAPAFPFTDRGGDALLILLETDQFGPEAPIPPAPPGPRAPPPHH